METRLKFFICSVAFNGSDGMKLPNLNDINEGKVIPSEEPCSFFENRTRYSCEPTPFLVSACLAKRLKRQHERTQDPKVEEFKQNIQNRRRNNSNRREYTQQKSDAEYASIPIVHVPKGFGVVPFHTKPQSDVVARYRQIAEVPAPNVSVLKQLLIGPEFEQPQSFHFSNSDVRNTAPYNNFSQCLPSEERATESRSSVSNISTLSHRMMNNGIYANINYKDAQNPSEWSGC